MNPTGEYVALSAHAAAPAPALRLRAAASVGADGALLLRFRATGGDVARVRVPAPQPPLRADGLWRHTCFEAFVADGTAGAYREFNFSPSGEWALYRFRGYRERDTDAFDDDGAPRITLRATATSLELDVRVPPRWLPPAASLRLGLAAVVEDRDGAVSYWALRHPRARPDFHDSDGFVLARARAAAPSSPERKP